MLQVFDLGQDVGRPFVPDRPVLGPLAENVCKGEAPDEAAGHGGAAVGDGVGLQEPRPVNVPIVGANRDLLFEVPTAASATQTFGWVASPGLLEQPVDGGRTDPEQLGANRLAQLPLFLFIKRQPQGQGGLQALGTHLLGFEPKKLQWLQHLGIVAPTGTRSFVSLARLSVQQPNRILAAVTADLAELVQDLTFEPPPHPLVAAPDRQ